MLTNYRSLSRAPTQIMPLNVKRARSKSAARSSKRSRSAITKAITNYKPGGIMYNPTGDAVPSAYRTKLKYFEQIGIVSDASGQWEYQFNMNSLYDPNRTSTGHQPLGFDQISALYQRYRVLTAKVSITNLNQSTSTTFGYWTFIVDSTTSTTVYNLIERAKYAKIMNVNSSSPENRITQKVDCAGIVGCSPVHYQSDDRYSAVVSSSPVETIIGHIGGQQLGTTGSTLWLAVQIEFYAEFFDPVELVQCITLT